MTLDRQAVVVLVTGGFLVVLAGDDGGYFARSWGWAGAALALVAGLAAATSGGGLRGRFEWLFAGGLAAVGLWTLASALWSQSPPSSIAEAQRSILPVAGALALLGTCRRRDAAGLLLGVLGAISAVSLANLVDRAGGVEPGTGGDAAPIGYANGLGLLAGLGVLLGMGLFREHRRGVRFLVTASLPLNVAVLGLSGSTGAAGAVMLGLAVAAIAAGGRVRLAGIAAALTLLVVGVATAGGHERGAYWSVALGSVASQPVLGTGAGTFWQVWLRERNEPRDTRDAHGLYVETLSEQGPLGLALLLAALAAPLLASLRTTRPFALGAYVTFLAHAGIDWDWELTGVTLPALAIGAALLLEARPREDHPGVRTRFVVGGVAASLFVAALVTLVGATALARARSSLRTGDTRDAEQRARAAATLSPWAAEPLLLAAQARALLGERLAAAAAARRGIERDPSDWRLWLALAEASSGAERERALARARFLNPLSTR